MAFWFHPNLPEHIKKVPSLLPPTPYLCSSFLPQSCEPSAITSSTSKPLTLLEGPAQKQCAHKVCPPQPSTQALWLTSAWCPEQPAQAPGRLSQALISENGSSQHVSGIPYGFLITSPISSWHSAHHQTPGLALPQRST